MVSADNNSLRGHHAAKNGTFQLMEDFIMEYSTEDHPNLTDWVNGTFSSEPDLDNEDSTLGTTVLGVMLMGIIAISSNAIVFLFAFGRVCRKTKSSSIHLFLCNLPPADVLVSSVFLPSQALLHQLIIDPSAMELNECTFEPWMVERVGMLYSITQELVLGGIPFSIILFCYVSISWKMCQNDRGQPGMSSGGPNPLTRRKKQTVRLSVMIIAAFVVCWIPYYGMMLWFWIDFDSALTMNPQIWRGLSIFACLSSCANPFLYGYRTLRRN